MINVYDFFSGCGGASAGFQKSGMNIQFGLDSNHDAAKTFKKNFPKAFFLENDIRNVNPEDLESIIDKFTPKLFCGCAPCQPFSKQNHNKNEKDQRINLLGEFARFIKYYKPDFVFVENVPGIQKIQIAQSPLEYFCSTLQELNYSYKTDLICAMDYGVPQPRQRLILIASRIGEPYFPSPEFGQDNLPPYSVVSDWISGLPSLNAGETDPNDPDHTCAVLSSINLRRIKNTPEGKGRESWPEDLELECHKGHKGHTDVYGRLAFNKISSTLTTKCTSYSNGRYGHPIENRALSVREAACLQTFDRDFSFSGGLGSKARQVGNAVPPLLAYKFGKMFLQLATED